MSSLYSLPQKVQVPKNARYAIIASRFNSQVVDKLIQGAYDALAQHKIPVATVDLIRVPGAFELPIIAKRLALSKKYDAIVALGAVIKGDTPHFEYVASAAVNGLLRVSLDESLPIILGVLTTNTEAEAHDRSGGKYGNKGFDAIITMFEILNLLPTI